MEFKFKFKCKFGVNVNLKTAIDKQFWRLCRKVLNLNTFSTSHTNITNFEKLFKFSSVQKSFLTFSSLLVSLQIVDKFNKRQYLEKRKYRLTILEDENDESDGDLTPMRLANKLVCVYIHNMYMQMTFFYKLSSQ